jgi:CBF1 interacting corepressor
MVAGMKFLSKKGFNPTNQGNRKKVWEREQEEKQEEQRYLERQKQLQKEKDDEELALSRGDIPRVQFLYNDPTTQQQQQEQKGIIHPVESINTNSVHCNQATNDNSITSFGQRQPGDDDAAAAFRQMIWMATASSTSDTVSTNTNHGDSSYSELNLRHPKMGIVLQGSSVDNRMMNNTTTNENINGTMASQVSSKTGASSAAASTALEKAVGKKQSTNTTVSLQEQMERFPQLKHAPRAKGMSMTDVNVSFKPLGAQIRNVKCLVCGVWGHSKGDRECQQSGWDPFSIKTVTSTSLLPPQQSAINNQSGTQDRKSSLLDRENDDGLDRQRDRENIEHSLSSSSYASEHEDTTRHRSSRHRSRKERKSEKKDKKRNKKEKKRSQKKTMKKHDRKPHKREKDNPRRSRRRDSDESTSDDDIMITKKRTSTDAENTNGDYCNTNDTLDPALYNDIGNHQRHEKRRRQLSDDMGRGR